MRECRDWTEFLVWVRWHSIAPFSPHRMTDMVAPVERGAWIGAAAGLTTGLIIAGTYKTEDWDPVMLPARTARVAGDARGAVTDAPVYRPRMRLKMRVAGHEVVGSLVDLSGDSLVLAKSSGHTTIP
jgi:hypothetical protein